MSELEEPQQKKRKMTPNPEDKSELAPVAGLLIKRHSDKARLPRAGLPLQLGTTCTGMCFCMFEILRHAYLNGVRSAETKVIPARGKALVDTQISVAVPAGTYGRVAPRSGLGMSVTDLPHVLSLILHLPLASKFMIDTGAGVIDADYRGIVFVLLFNLSDQDFTGQFYTTPCFSYGVHANIVPNCSKRGRPHCATHPRAHRDARRCRGPGEHSHSRHYDYSRF